MTQMATYYGEHQAEDAMSVMAGWIGRNSKIKVVYHDGTAVDANVYDGVIRVPRLACASGITQEALMLLRSRVYHEAGHIDVTYLPKDKFPQGALKEIWNALEDRRMEAVEASKYKGCEMAFRWSKGHYNKKIAQKITAGEVDAPLWEALVAMGFLVDGVQPVWNLSPKAQAYVEASYDEFLKVKICKNASDALELAKVIYKILKQKNEDWKKQNQQPNQNQQNQQQNQQNQQQNQKGDKGEEGEPQSGMQKDFDDYEKEENQPKNGKPSEDESEESDESEDKESKEKTQKKSKDKKGEDSEGEESEESDKNGKDSEKKEGSDDGEETKEDSKSGSDSDKDGSKGTESEEDKSKNGNSEGDEDEESGKSEGDDSLEDSTDSEDDDSEGEEGDGDGEGEEDSSSDEDEVGEGEKGDSKGDSKEDGKEGEESAEDDADQSDASGSGSDEDDTDGDTVEGDSKGEVKPGDAPYDPRDNQMNDGDQRDLEEEFDGFSNEEAVNEDLEEYFKNLPPADKAYLSRRDLDQHLIPSTTDGDKQAYRIRLSDVSVTVASMTRALEQALRTMSMCRKNGYQRAGKIDHNRLVSIAKSLSKEVFFTIKEGTSLDVAVEIVIDESGSMGNYYEVQILAMAIGEALNAIGIPFEITGSTTNGNFNHMMLNQGFTRVNPIVYQHYKNFNENWGNVRHRMVHTGAHRNNIDGEVVEYAAFRLMQRRERRKVIFSLSDGEPCAGQGNDGDMCQNLKRVCDRVRKQGIEVYGFGIGTESPRKFYGEKWFLKLDNVKGMGSTFVREFVKIITLGQVKV